MSVRLLVKQRGEAGGANSGTEMVVTDPTITLGRDPSCQVVLAQKAVSRSHARIVQDGPLCFIEDLGSAYGTQVNGEVLPKGEKRLLRNGDTIAIAQFDLTFDRVSAAAAKDADEKTSALARRAVQDVMRGTGDGPFFRIMSGAGEGQRIELAEGQELVVGRDGGEANIVFKDDMVSRRHAKLRRDWSGTHVEDLNSRNGIKVNKRRVTRRTLKDRDEVEIGSTRLLFLDPSEVREAPVAMPDGAEDTKGVPVPEEASQASMVPSDASEVPADEAVAESPDGEDPEAAADEDGELPEEEEGLEDEEYEDEDELLDENGEPREPPQGLARILALFNLPRNRLKRRKVIGLMVMTVVALMAIIILLIIFFA